MFKVAIPSVKCVFVSYYLVVAHCRNSNNIHRFVTKVSKYENKTLLFNVHCTNFSTCQKRRREPPWRIIYFGTDEFSLSCLEPLNAKLNTGTLLSGLGVVSQQGSLVHKFAESEKLPIHNWPPDDNILSNYDMGVVVSYGKLIPERIINGLPLGVLNVHGSLLPRWRGAAPIAYAIMNGDSETGVTIMRIKPHKFDIGDIVRQYRCSISSNETTPELSRRLAMHAAELLMDCVRDLPRCLDMAYPQSADGVTFAPKLIGTLSRVDWKKLSAKRVYDLHRAISHKYGLSTTWFDKPVRLFNVTSDYSDEPLSERKKNSHSLSPSLAQKAALNFLNSSTFDNDKNEITDSNVDISPGRINYDKKKQTLKVQCCDGKWIQCMNFKVLNGRIISTVDFFNGFLSKQNKKDWYFK